MMMQLHIPFFGIYKYAKLSRRDVNDMNTRGTHALYLLNYFTRCVCFDVFVCRNNIQEHDTARGFVLFLIFIRCHYGHATAGIAYILSPSSSFSWMCFVLHIGIYFHILAALKREITLCEGWCFEKSIYLIVLYRCLRALKTLLFVSYI